MPSIELQSLDIKGPKFTDGININAPKIGIHCLDIYEGKIDGDMDDHKNKFKSILLDGLIKKRNENKSINSKCNSH